MSAKLAQSADILTIGGTGFRRGDRGVVRLPIGSLIDHQTLEMPVHVFRGRRTGPCMVVCAAVHGDEINGIEIIRQLINHSALKRLRGDLLAVPVVNVPAFLSRSRYLPDRRDLNRLFPGSTKGSLGARLAKVFVDEVLAHAAMGIDLHTGAVYRPNLPQIRFSPEAPGARELALAFRPPVVIESEARSGTLREWMHRHDKPMLTFEGGEALRLDIHVVRSGLLGVVNAMRSVGMLPEKVSSQQEKPMRVVFTDETSWVRAPQGGILRPGVKLGQAVAEGMEIGRVGDPFGPGGHSVVSSTAGVVIGMTTQTVVDEGDGLFHIAMAKNPEQAERRIKMHQADAIIDEPVDDDPLTD
ncbi:MAG: succinylglutamate desuccinylase/aspartoacylase family protein [Verrucomicrobiales bacterium]